MKRAVFAGLLAVGVMLTGCSQSTPPPTQFSTVTVSPAAETPNAASPSAAGSAGTSSTPGPDKVAEAEQIFVEFETAFAQEQAAGGSSSLPDSLARLSAPPLSVEIQQLLAKQKLDGWRITASPLPKVVTHGAISGVHRGGSEVTISGCVDATNVKILQPGKEDRPGAAVEYRAYFKTISGKLTYFDSDSRDVAKC